MSEKLTHLPLIYGDAGAREKFQELVIQLIRAERPDVAGIRIVRGDGGIDAHEGSLIEPGGVDVYQIKYLPSGIDDSQNEQIRESFRTIRDQKSFKTRSWRLCLPVDMGVEEKKWFDTWAAKQADIGIVILTPWGATELEGLLYKENNRHLVEAYFPQRQQINAAVYLGQNAINVSGPNAIQIGPNGINIQGPVISGNSTSRPKSETPRRPLSEIEFKVLVVVGTTKDCTVKDAASKLGIGMERATFYLDELFRTHRLVDRYSNMDRRIPDRYLLTHEGRRLLVEENVFP